jgi:hypothetical protein
VVSGPATNTRLVISSCARGHYNAEARIRVGTDVPNVRLARTKVGIWYCRDHSAGKSVMRTTPVPLGELAVDEVAVQTVRLT